MSSTSVRSTPPLDTPLLRIILKRLGELLYAQPILAGHGREKKRGRFLGAGQEVGEFGSARPEFVAAFLASGFLADLLQAYRVENPRSSRLCRGWPC
ncbi:hypothetical protein [Beijerinckia indica]|uniref:hypothetical protein n=1 Tax=Beijerinckia indica TaxID=533 RepID=UPI0005A09F27|nr:hypothetical protein [Beijerinckia indica]